MSWLSLGGNKEIAVVEYVGQFPGLAPHGNSKHKTEYVRTSHNVMVEMGEMLKNSKLQLVYDKLAMKYDELSGPANHQQLYDKKNREMKKERKQNGQFYSRNNIADHIKEIENMVTGNHPFVRSVVRQSGKSPSVILYSQFSALTKLSICVTCMLQFRATNRFRLQGRNHPNHPFSLALCIFMTIVTLKATVFSLIILKVKLSGVDTCNLVFGSG